MQLCICQYGIWNDDGECWICVVLFAFYKSYCVYRSIPVCPDHIFKQWGIHCDDRSDGTLDEQQAEFLQSFIFGDIPKDGKKETLYDPYDDRRNVCSKLYDLRQR